MDIDSKAAKDVSALVVLVWPGIPLDTGLSHHSPGFSQVSLQTMTEFGRNRRTLTLTIAHSWET